MKPRKKSNSEYIIAALALLFVLFFSWKCGLALTQKAEIEQATEVTEGVDTFSLFFDCLEEQLNSSEVTFVWNEQMKTAFMYGGFIWFVCAASYFSSKKKFIAGKEYGTAEWATDKDIKDLFAVNIMNKEIQQAKQVKTPIGRYFAKSKIKAQCKKNAEDVRKIEMRRLTEWYNNALPQGKKLSKEQQQQRKEVINEYKNRKAKIDDAAETTFNNSFTEAWKPNALKKQYDVDVADVNYQYQQKLSITTEEERQEALKKAEVKYQSALADFYSGKARIEKIKKKYENADAIFTKTERISIYNYKLNNNTLILGGSGSGKTRGFVMPNILQAHSSFVVTDPKGEILEKSGYFLEKVKGYKIRVLNLDNKKQSDGYNPFVYIHPEREGYEERVLSLIEAIIINTDGGEKKGGSDPFWDKAERLFLQAIFFFVCDGFTIEERNMNTVLKLIGMLQIGEEQDNKDSDLDFFAATFEEKHGADHIGVQQYKEFREKASGKTAKSIVISAVARLAPFRTSEVKRIFSYDTMHLEKLGEEKTAIFVVVPPTDTTFNFIAGMLFTQMFQELQYCATQVHKHDGQRLPVPVRFILDEFANTCTIPQFVKILAYARSFGIGIVPILQSLEQIKNMYKDEWGVIVDNCNTLLYLGSITHMDTLEYMSKLLGKGTFDKKTTGRTRGRSGSSSQNLDVIGRDLMDASEIRKLPKENCLFVVGGRNPFYSLKYNYSSHPNYIYTSDANSAYSYEYKPEKPPKTAKQEEQSAAEIKAEKQAEITRRLEEIRARIDSEMQEIQITVLQPNNVKDLQTLITRLTASFNDFIPVRDELLTVSDGTDADTEEALLAALNFDEEDKAIDDMIAANIESRKEEITEKVDAEIKEQQPLVLPVKEVVKEVLKRRENLEVVSDNLLSINDGTDIEEEISKTIEDEWELTDEEEVPQDNDLGDMGAAVAEAFSNLADTLEEVGEADI